MRRVVRSLLVALVVVTFASPVHSQRKDSDEKHKNQGPRYGGNDYHSSYDILDEKPLIVDPSKSVKKDSSKQVGVGAGAKPAQTKKLKRIGKRSTLVQRKLNKKPLNTLDSKSAIHKLDTTSRNQ